MRQEMVKFIFAGAIFLLFIWRIHRGFINGMMQEIVNILSGVIALASVVLIFFAISSFTAKAMSTLTVCIIGLALLGIVFKLCNLIFQPLLAMGNLSVIGGLNKLLGAVMGAAEAVIFSYLLYRALDYVGICVL